MNKNKEKLVEIGQHFKKIGYLAAADGNFSTRIDDQRILITPSGRNKDFLTQETIAMMDISGTAISGTPSSESRMHIEIYRKHERAKWVFHTHPPYATAWSLCHPEADELPLSALPEVALGIGSAPIVKYATPGSSHLAESLSEASLKSKAIVMQRHGVVAWGETWEETINAVERIEHAAKILCIAQSIGGYTSIDDADMMVIKEKRAALGERSL